MHLLIDYRLYSALIWIKRSSGYSFLTTFSFGGLILKYYFVGFSGKIGKEVEYVIHGVEEMSSHVISKLRKDFVTS